MKKGGVFVCVCACGRHSQHIDHCELLLKSDAVAGFTSLDQI